MDNLPNKIPNRIKQYLNDRGLSDEILILNEISWDGTKIVIPIFDINGMFLYNKYRRDPSIDSGPKYMYDVGSKITLYGIHHLKLNHEVIICEGEFDALILQSKGFCAITSTGGATSFQEEWLEVLKDKDVYVVIDRKSVV